MVARTETGEGGMDRARFEAELREEGYAEIIERRMDANTVNPEHAHEFDARLLVLDGIMTIASEGAERSYRPGDTFTMRAGCRHTERSGPDGASYLAGRRYANPAG
jgi:quercetin dioxygenase-like cupin family protein